MTPILLLAQAADGPGILYQYGAIGVVLLGAIYAMRTLFNEKVKAHDLDRQRADRMEAEVHRLNALIQDKMLPVLGEATKIISEALSVSRRKGS